MAAHRVTDRKKRGDHGPGAGHVGSSTRWARARAGVALGVTVPVPSLAVLIAMWWWPGTLAATGAYFVSKLWQAIAPVAWRVGVERGPISLSPPRHGGVGWGIALGLVIAGIILGGYLLLGPMLIADPQAFRDMAAKNALDDPRRYLALAGLLTVGNALLEEYFWRWFVFRQCETLLGGGGNPRKNTAEDAGAARAEPSAGVRRSTAVAAVVMAAVFFTLHHIFALAAQFRWVTTLLGASGVCIGGLVWSGLYARRRSIWPGYVSHAIVDAAVFVVGWWLLFG